ncbi:helix-turn-helix transcriptional regulator [Streptomyces sp. OF3]|uniref:Helix-turn-helix transcriptional regulator n=1 Tax=Streptomyces alkaliterrae TaxID=2213162 RepID=A0A7W3ZQK5_9ACTN|nr:helix-turn-helix transcriptional regulator [Streptomyces alkaliterrae]MBB1256751.1 helix-turn-helix transcriptional regulator [Streptomyces alkaliterrae]
MDARHTDGSPLSPDAMIARRLRQHREARNLSQRALADLVGYPQSYISRAENQLQRIGDGLAEALDEKLGTNGEFVALLEMARALLIEPGARNVVKKETQAARIRVFTSSIIPGLLQTERYARGLLRTGLPRESTDDITERVAARMDRRSRVFGKKDRPLYRAVIDEAALARRVASDEVMAEQLHALLGYEEDPHLRVLVLPFGAGEHGMMGGSLDLLDLESGGTIALVESFRTGEPVESPRGVVE